jgi:DNA polymerase V
MVGHLDADCFYVSAERVRHPDLIGKPTGIMGNNGACVIAKSYEMKATGVKTGTPIWVAKDLCPEGVYVKRDFRWYEVLSRHMLEIVRGFFTPVEYYSIDEFFFKADPLRPGQPLKDVALEVRDVILEKAQLPVTVGIGRTRTLAKLFSDTAKPFGAVAVTTKEHERELLSRLPVTEISGIAGRRAARLSPYGIRTCLQLADANGQLIYKLLTKTGYNIWLELNGRPVEQIHTERQPHKVLARGGSLMGHIDDPKLLWAWCVRHVERLIEELSYHNVRTQSLAVCLAWKNAESTGGTYRLPCASDRFGDLIDAARTSLDRAYLQGETATHMHVIAPQLVRPGNYQPSLFDEADPNEEAIAAVKKAINERFGRFKLRSASTLRLPAVYDDPANDFDICDVRGKVCF